MMEDDWPGRVISFWFGELSPGDWYASKSETDAAIREGFLPLHLALAKGDEVLHAAEPALAAVIVLDQFSRNLFRGSAQAFSTDVLALRIARAAVKKGFDTQLSEKTRAFFYLPFEHSEAIEDQERAVVLFEALGDAELSRFAVEHRDIIARFGRFPHRNRALGRTSTVEEQQFLSGHKGFGQ